MLFISSTVCPGSRHDVCESAATCRYILHTRTVLSLACLPGPSLHTQHNKKTQLAHQERKQAHIIKASFYVSHEMSSLSLHMGKAAIPAPCNLPGGLGSENKATLLHNQVETTSSLTDREQAGYRSNTTSSAGFSGVSFCAPHPHLAEAV